MIRYVILMVGYAVLTITMLLFARRASADVVIHPQGCTADAKAVMLALALADTAPPAAATRIAHAFSRTAKRFIYVQLISREGWEAFVAEVGEADWALITGLDGPPRLTGASCSGA